MDYILPEADDIYYDSLSMALPRVGKNVDFQKLLLRFQDVATTHINKLGFGDDYKTKNNFYYVVCRIEVIFHRMVEENEPLTIVTFPNKIGGLQFYRYAYVLDAEKKPVADITSLWVMIDQTTRRLKPARFFAKDFEEKLPKINEMPRLTEKLNALNFSDLDMQGKASYQVKEEDIDSNQHMNNTSYLKIVQLQGVDKEVKSFSIDFEKECYLGENINLTTFEDKEKLCVVGTKDDGAVSFRCKLNF